MREVKCVRICPETHGPCCSHSEKHLHVLLLLNEIKESNRTQIPWKRNPSMVKEVFARKKWRKKLCRLGEKKHLSTKEVTQPLLLTWIRNTEFFNSVTITREQRRCSVIFLSLFPSLMARIKNLQMLLKQVMRLRLHQTKTKWWWGLLPVIWVLTVLYIAEVWYVVFGSGTHLCLT